MADEWHIEWLREGVVRWNRRRKKVKFSPDLTGVRFFDLLPPDFRDDPKTSRYFERIDLSNANLSDADLSDLNFTKARFDGANLANADMSLSNFSGASFVESNLLDVDARNSIFSNALFESPVLSGANFEAAEAIGTTFIETQISRNQEEFIGTHSTKIYTSRASYRDAMVAREAFGQARTSEKSEQADERTKKNKYDVFFGTDRQPVIERGALVDFDGSRAGQLSYGICEVIVPEGHRIGSLGSPLWKRLLNRKDDRLKIESLIALNRELFFQHYHQSLESMKVPGVPTLFVHGYNTSFKNAVLRAAQIGFDLGLGQGIGLYSWPSKGRKRGYAADEATIEASKYHLADFIEGFASNNPKDGINIIAHSMGCRCLLGAFEVLSGQRPTVLKMINQVILAAADVDAAAMVHLGKHAINNCVRTTSYVSDKDKALMVSEWLHDYPRVGVMPPTFVLDGMDTIIVNNLALGDFSHGYVGTSRTILNDIFALLQSNAPPISRFSIARHEVADATCWRLKE